MSDGKMKHTPGPLYVGTMNDGLFIIDKPPHPAPNDTGPHDWPNGPRVVAKLADNDARARADASLYAAASDLLEALSGLMKEIENSAQRPSMIAQNRARAALAKAEANPQSTESR